MRYIISKVRISEVVLLVTIWEVLDRVEEGPACKETDFDLNIFSATVNRLIMEHNLKCTPEEPIPNDNTLADEVFEAGLELALEVGMLCTSTSRRIVFEEAEIKEIKPRISKYKIQTFPFSCILLIFHNKIIY